MCRKHPPNAMFFLTLLLGLFVLTHTGGCGRDGSSASASAAPGLAGTFVDEQGKPLADVRVSLRGLAVDAKTDAQGKFTITPPGGAETYSLSFVAPGYAEQYRSLPWKNKSVDFQTITMRAVDLSTTVALCPARRVP